MVESRVGDGTLDSRTESLSRPLLWANLGADQSELQQLIEARLVLEESIASFARRTRTGRRTEAHPSRTRRDAGLFHIAIGEAAHNPILSDADQLMRNLMKQWILPPAAW